jgi:hypothetical protein
VNDDHPAHPNPDLDDPDLDDPDIDRPTDRPDLDHLRPDRIRIGSVGVFAGDWAWTPDAAGAIRIPVGFVGTLIDTFSEPRRSSIWLLDARAGILIGQI